MFSFKKITLFLFICYMCCMSSIMAQPQLNRISIAERSDGNGYVIRYHLTQMVDDYDLSQPETDRIQMQLLSPTLDTEMVEMPEPNEVITEIELIEIEGGVGIDIHTAEGVYFMAEAYPDQNLRDLLLNLEYTTQTDAEQLITGYEPYPWSLQVPDTETEVEPEPEQTKKPQPEEDFPQVRKRSWNVQFGIAGGIGLANKIGGSYTSDPRRQTAMGLTVSIGLPFTLPYDIDTFFESGLFNTQKGFKNPSGDLFRAETVVLDYIEIPMMGKFRYSKYRILKPFAAAGVYTAFRTVAETVQEDGDRNNLGDVSKNVDWGLKAGLGTELVFEKATVFLQANYGAGVPRLFKENFSGSERPGYLTLMFGIQF